MIGGHFVWGSGHAETITTRERWTFSTSTVNIHHQPSGGDQIEDFRPFVENSFKTPKALRMGVLKVFFFVSGVDSTPLQEKNGSKNSTIWSHREGWWSMVEASTSIKA